MKSETSLMQTRGHLKPSSKNNYIEMTQCTIFSNPTRSVSLFQMTPTMPEFVRTVLCVDDDADDREIITGTIALIDPSFNVVHAKDGLEAIEYLSRSKDSALPCLIILDINMPRMDGKQTLVELKKDEVLNVVPIVIFSTSSNPMDIMYFEMFDVEMITKPSDITAMQQDIKRVLQFCAAC